MDFFWRGRRTLQIFAKIWRYLRLSDFEGANHRDLKKRASRELIRHFNFKVDVDHGESDSFAQVAGPAIYVCNHISYMDIPLVISLLPDTSFVSKSEVAAWPVIGKAARRIETIFVKRECKDSREDTRKAITEALLKDAKKIVIFPSGTTSIEKTDRWRKGIFEVARENSIPVVPLRLQYSPLRKLAYIGDDNFIKHLFELARLPQVDVKVEFGQVVQVTDAVQDCALVKKWCEEHMGASLL